MLTIPVKNAIFFIDQSTDINNFKYSLKILYVSVLICQNVIISSELLSGNYYKAYSTCLFYRKCDVVNRGLSGYNSRWGRILLPHILPLDLLKDTVIATVFFGANDASLAEIAPDKYVSVEDYSANLKV